MINVVVFEGGLGNQMFQYAFYLVLKKRYPYSLFLFDIEKSLCCHNGFELSRIFNIRTNTRCKIYNFLQSHFGFILSKFTEVRQDNSLKYDSTYINLPKGGCSIKGFWQSEKWFLDISDKVRSTFVFKTEFLNSDTALLANTIKSGKNIYCSIHIRRGDYLVDEGFGVIGLGYYKEAIQMIRTKVSVDVRFCVFSDDQDWCKSNIVLDATYVDWNSGKDAWQDMYLMSLCHHNIIANSSFSWWGAWLNNNPNKLVIAPQRWFLYTDNYDILPQTWEQMTSPCENYC